MKSRYLGIKGDVLLCSNPLHIDKIKTAIFRTTDSAPPKVLDAFGGFSCQIQHITEVAIMVAQC